MQKNIEPKKWEWFLVLLSALICGILSFYNWIGDSEFWPITLSQNIFNFSVEHPSLWYKPVFHLPLAWIHLLGLENITHIKLAKFIFAALGSFALILCWRLARRELSPARSFSYLFLLLSSSVFVSYMGSIRSDVLATYFILLFIFLWPKIWTWPQERQFLTLTLFVLLALLTTPKSILALLFPLICFFLGNQSSKNSWILIRWAVLLFAGFISLWLLFITGLFPAPFAAMQKALQQYQLFWQDEGILSVNHWLWSHLVQDKWMLGAGLILSLFSLFVSLRSKNSFMIPAKYLCLIGFGVLTAGFFHSPKLPYFAASLVPLWSLSWIPALRRLPSWLAFVFTLATLLISLSIGRLEYFHASNKIQFETLEVLSRLEKDLYSPTWFDGLGLLPRQRKPLSYLGPHDPSTKAKALERVFQGQFQVILTTHRVLPLGNEFNLYVQENYQSPQPGLWIRKDIKIPRVEKLPGKFWQVFHFSPPQRGARKL